MIKVNPDAPQIPVRRMALHEGKTVYMAVPKLRAEKCFIELDPARLGKNLAKAATIKGAARFGLLRCGSRYPKPRGIYWEFLAEEKIAVIPALLRLHGRLG